MSKKQKRRVSPAVKPTAASTEIPMPSPKAIPSARSRTAAIFEFKPDYSYIFRDLKRIGILAGSFFAILVILSFFLR
jgi:hypothetical protein